MKIKTHFIRDVLCYYVRWKIRALSAVYTVNISNYHQLWFYIWIIKLNILFLRALLIFMPLSSKRYLKTVVHVVRLTGTNVTRPSSPTTTTFAGATECRSRRWSKSKIWPARCRTWLCPCQLVTGRVTPTLSSISHIWSSQSFTLSLVSSSLLAFLTDVGYNIILIRWPSN